MNTIFDLGEFISAEYQRSELMPDKKNAVDSVLNTLNNTSKTCTDVFDLWYSLDEQIGKTDDTALRDILGNLRLRLLDK